MGIAGLLDCEPFGPNEESGLLAAASGLFICGCDDDDVKVLLDPTPPVLLDAKLEPPASPCGDTGPDGEPIPLLPIPPLIPVEESVVDGPDGAPTELFNPAVGESASPGLLPNPPFDELDAGGPKPLVGAPSPGLFPNPPFGELDVGGPNPFVGPPKPKLPGPLPLSPVA